MERRRLTWVAPFGLEQPVGDIEDKRGRTNIAKVVQA